MTANEQPSILICDDSIEEIRVLVAMLRNAKYRLIIATNGQEAVNRAGLLRPDLILMDIRMPGMDGITACRLLKAHVDTKDIPLIFLTAANDPLDRLTGLRIGAADYVVKPACEEEVLLRIAIHIKGSRRDEKPHFQPEGHMRHTSATVEACIRILEEDLSQSPSTQDLAKQLGCTRKFLTAAFKEVFDSTVYEWLRERRMGYARQMLAETNTPIQDVSDYLGFSSSSNFSTAFKSKFGMSPREFRKTSRPDILAEEDQSEMLRRSYVKNFGAEICL